MALSSLAGHRHTCMPSENCGMMRMACRHRISARPIFDQLSSVPWSGSQELGKGLTFFLELREKKKKEIPSASELEDSFPKGHHRRDKNEVQTGKEGKPRP